MDLVVNVHINTESPTTSAREIYQSMDNVKVLVDAITEQWIVHLSRVPVVGEHIKIPTGTYIVRQVVHQANDSVAARVVVNLSLREV